MTPLDGRRNYGSVRSILREANTPGSGQNVRFFSRDAYKVISPDSSSSAGLQSGSQEHIDDPAAFMQRLQDASSEQSPMTPGQMADETRYHSANPSPATFDQEASHYHSANASANVFSSPHAGDGDATNFHSANSSSPATPYTPAGGNMTNYESANDSPHAMSSVTTFQSPISAFADGIPEATSTPYVTPHQSQVQSSGLPAPPSQLNGLFEPPQKQGLAGTDPNDFDNAMRNAPGLRPTINTQTGNRTSSHSTASSMSLETPNSVFHGSDKSIRRFSDQSQFHSMADDAGDRSAPERAGSALGFSRMFKRDSASAVEGRMDFPAGSINSNRMRSFSDRVFSRPTVNDSKQKHSGVNDAPFTDSDSPSSAKEEPDPFRADASNYYNSAAGFPNTPPRIGHVRADSGVSGMTAQTARSFSGTSSILSGRSQTSRSGSLASVTQTRGLPDDDMVTALRTQLAFHQELANQYERDLRARDAHANLMNQKVQAYEAEAEKRSKAMRGMRRRVAELERAAAAMEEQSERSQQESFERSIFEGTSGEVVKSLHQQIIDLGKVQNDMIVREKEQKAENERLKSELHERDEALAHLRDQIESLQGADLSAEDKVNEARKMVVESEQNASMAIEHHREIEFAWAEEQARMLRDAEVLKKQLEAKQSELGVLKQEVEAQWANTEKLNSRVDEVRKREEAIERERDQLKGELESLHARVEEMEFEWTESENRKAQLEDDLQTERASKVNMEHERDEVGEMCLIGLWNANTGFTDARRT